MNKLSTISKKRAGDKPKRKLLSCILGASLSLLLFLICITLINTCKAQENELAPNNVKAVITSKSAVEVGKNIIINGGKSVFPEGSYVGYLWELGDGRYSREEEVVHVYTKPGRYQINLEINVKGLKRKTSKEIFVYTKIISLINDSQERNIRIQGLKNIAEQNGVLLKDMSSFSNLTKKQELLEHIEEEKDVFKNSETIIFWVDDIRLLGLMRDFQGVQKDILSLDNKNVIIITNQSISHTYSTVRNYFYNNYPEQLIITRPEAIDEVLLMDTKFLPGILQERGYDVKLVSEGELRITSPLHVFSRLINEAQKKGFPDDFVLIFLLLPIIILITNIGKNLLGISTVKISIPILLTITFYFTGFVSGAIIFIIAFAASLITKRFLKKYHLLPISKVSISLTIIIVVLFIALLMVSSSGAIDIQRTPVYPILLLLLFTDQIVNIEKKSVLRNLGVLGETIFLSGIAYLVITITALQLLLLSYPEIIFLVILLNIPVGRYTGLTMKEYIRFKDIIFKEE
jgi:hypothetical protein